jgi:hypothetical protein
MKTHITKCEKPPEEGRTRCDKCGRKVLRIKLHRYINRNEITESSVKEKKEATEESTEEVEDDTQDDTSTPDDSTDQWTCFGCQKILKTRAELKMHQRTNCGGSRS